MVLLHGLGASHAQFTSITKDVRGVASFLLIDLPAHGENQIRPNDQISFDIFCNLILELCDKLRIKTAVFAGISMGGALALMCAARRPDLVQRLVVVRPSWLVSPAPEHLSLIDRCGQLLMAAPVAQAQAQLEADPTYIDMRDDVPLAAASVRGVFERAHAKEHAPALSAMFHSAPFYALTELRAIKTPCIVVGSHADSLHPIAIANATANALPQAEFRILPPRYLQPDKHQAALNEMILDTIGVSA